VKRKWRKPLIVLTPKSLLREPLVMSPLTDFTEGMFQPVMPDASAAASTPSRIIIASGKICIDLEKARAEQSRDDVVLIRLEQYYPLPSEALRALLESYPADIPVVWVQEEPRNMGAWYFMKIKWDESGLAEDWPLQVVCRPESASPSTGSKKSHKLEQDELIRAALGTMRAGISIPRIARA
jgi:2-oxoglutarate dehydrogenase E1 component